MKVFGSKLDLWREDIFLKRLSSSQEKLSSLDYAKDYDNINLPKQHSKLQEILNSLGNELQAICFVSKQAWQSISERFLGRLPEQQEIRISQERVSEHIRAKEVLEEQNAGNNKIYKKENQQAHTIRTVYTPNSSRAFENDAHGTGVCLIAGGREFKEQISAHKTNKKNQALTNYDLKSLPPLQKIEVLLREAKFACTPAEKEQAKANLKIYAQELYKQDPTFKSIRDKDMELTKEIRAILFEENRNKQLVRDHDR